ncbi:MAG: hypothetical protein ABEL97_06810 [Salinibacter sp.]
MIIENQRRDTVWTAQFGRNILARILWTPTLQSEGIPPGERKEVPLSNVMTDEEEDEIVVFWWEAVVEEGQRKPGETRSFAVVLHD